VEVLTYFLVDILFYRSPAAVRPLPESLLPVLLWFPPLPTLLLENPHDSLFSV
jgi:hypothetical protein